MHKKWRKQSKRLAGLQIVSFTDSGIIRLSDEEKER